MNKKSFTLIELLVVIAIIGILSSLVIARFSNWNDEAKIANTLQWSAGMHRKLGSNMLAHWRMDECSGTDVADISGYGNHGTIQGVVPFQADTPSGEGCSLRFNSNSSNFLETNFNWNQLQEMTFSIWFKIDDWDTRGVIGNYYHTPETNNRGRMFYRNGGDTSGLMRWIVGYKNISEEYTGVAPTYQDLSLNKWHHSVFVAKINGEYQLYLDSKAYSTSNASNFSSWQSAVDGGADDKNINIGKTRPGSSNWPMKGNIDDVRIYDTALTAEEVGRIYAESKDQYLAYE